MSLKAFHLLFISLSIVLAVVFGLWSMDVYRHGESIGYLVTGLFSFASAIALGFYGTAIFRKFRRIGA